MPSLGLGTFKAGPTETASAVRTALQCGYRLLDCASVYGNEAEVGEGIAAARVPRERVFVTTKLWILDFGFEKAIEACEASLARLKLDYLDLYLLHWPLPSDFEATVQSYKALEDLLARGRVRSIGVSNFNANHLQNLLEQVDVVPAVNQIEVHPYFSQAQIRDFNKRNGVQTQSWSPLGGIYLNRPKDPSSVTRLLDEPALLEIAEQHSKSPAQIVLRWHIQSGLATIPKSVNANRLAANLAIFEFELSSNELEIINSLERGQRGGPDPDLFDLETVNSRR
jgi:diketogulonate reductase-like aldo/keto reductase